jgi:5-methylcytosine-specific restriction protein B
LARKDILPHVLILDEINRVDLSRVFGEVFSAMENRNSDITTAVGDFKLNIPKSLYIIGTMNEIDFSLEQIDFALRRRFLWFSYGYDPNILKDIVFYKNEKQKAGLSISDIDRLINAATTLNKAIALSDELGEQFEIGHTFFAEVVDVYSSFKAINNKTNRIKDKLFRAHGPAIILWDISIKPISEAYLGNVEEEEKKTLTGNLKDIFFNGSLEG